MAKITFEVDATQFVRPDGKELQFKVDLPRFDNSGCPLVDLKEQYELMRSVGLRFTSELIPSATNKSKYIVSLVVDHPELEADYICEITENNEEVRMELAKIIRNFDIEHFQKWQADIKEDYDAMNEYPEPDEQEADNG